MFWTMFSEEPNPLRTSPYRNCQFASFLVSQKLEKIDAAREKYVNIPSGKYIYVHKYVYIHTYVKWMRTGLMLAWHKNGWVPVLWWLVIKMDEYRSYDGLS